MRPGGQAGHQAVPVQTARFGDRTWLTATGLGRRQPDFADGNRTWPTATGA